MSVMSERQVVTRKDHACAYCGGTIPKGSRVTCEHGIFDGRPYTAYTCESCEPLMVWFYRYCRDEDVIYFDWFRDFLAVAAMHDPFRGIERLAAKDGDDFEDGFRDLLTELEVVRLARMHPLYLRTYGSNVLWGGGCPW